MRKEILGSIYPPLPSPVQQMKERGNLEEAEAYLQHLLETGGCPPEEWRRFRAGSEILRRLPTKYPCTRAEALEPVRRYVPNLSEAGFGSFLMKGKLFWCYLGGEARFFGRFLSSLCKTNSFLAEAATKQGHCISGSDRRLLQENMEKMRAQGELSVRITVRARFELEEAFSREGALIRAHLSLSRVAEEQIDIVLEEMSTGGQLSAGSATQRVIFQEERLGGNHPFITSYRFSRTERYRDVYGSVERIQTEDRKVEQSKNGTTKYGVEEWVESGYDSALFPPSTYLRSFAAGLTAGVTEPLIRAKYFYDFITKKVRYSSTSSCFCLDRMAERYAMDRAGGRGIRAFLFLSPCESVEIPARRKNGLKTEPKFIGAHDQVRFYTLSLDWRVADLSYGGSTWKSGDERLHCFYPGNVDPWYMAANARIFGKMGFLEPKFRVDPYDNRVGGMALNECSLCHEEFRCGKEVLRAEEISQVIRP